MFSSKVAAGILASVKNAQLAAKGHPWTKARCNGSRATKNRLNAKMFPHHLANGTGRRARICEDDFE